MVQNFEKATRYEDVAKLYEELELWEDAGRVRRLAMTSRTVSVDLNALIRQLREGGVTSAYACPRCGASMKISGDTSADALGFCDYRGTAFQVQDLATFLRTVIWF